MKGRQITFLVLIQNALGLIASFQVETEISFSILHLNLITSTLITLIWMYRAKPPSSTPDQLYLLGYRLYVSGYASLILNLVCTISVLIFAILLWDTVPDSGRISAGLSLFIYAFIPIILTTFRHVEDNFHEIFFERGRLIILEGDKLPMFLQKRKIAQRRGEFIDIAVNDQNSSERIPVLSSKGEINSIQITDKNNTSFEKFLATYFGRLYQLYEKKTVQLSMWRLELDFVKKCLVDPQITSKFKFLN